MRQKFFSAESKSKAWTEHSSWGSGHGKHTHTGELDNCRSRTKCTQRRQHVVQSGNIVSTLKSTALTQNNAGESKQRTVEVHLPVSVLPPSLLFAFLLTLVSGQRIGVTDAQSRHAVSIR